MKKKMDSLSSGKKVETGADVPKETGAPAEEAPKTDAPAVTEAPTAEGTATPPTPESTPDPAAAPTEPAPDSFESLFPEPRAALGAPPSWLWWVLLLIVSVVLAVAGYALTQKNLRAWLSTEPTPSPTASVTPTPTETPTPTTTPEPTATPAPVPTVDPASITMRVLNGTSTTGAAAKAKTTLEAAGFSVRTTGNAKSQTYATTMVYYQAGKLPEAEAVKTALSGYTVTLEESTLADPDNILVVIGKQ